jgi:hypothetical protein
VARSCFDTSARTGNWVASREASAYRIFVVASQVAWSSLRTQGPSGVLLPQAQCSNPPNPNATRPLLSQGRRLVGARCVVDECPANQTSKFTTAWSSLRTQGPSGVLFPQAQCSNPSNPNAAGPLLSQGRRLVECRCEVEVCLANQTSKSIPAWSYRRKPVSRYRPSVLVALRMDTGFRRHDVLLGESLCCFIGWQDAAFGKRVRWLMCRCVVNFELWVRRNPCRLTQTSLANSPQHL